MAPVLTSDGVMSTLRNLNMIPDSLMFTSSGLQRVEKGFLEQDRWSPSVFHALHRLMCVSCLRRPSGCRGDSINPQEGARKRGKKVLTNSVFLGFILSTGYETTLSSTTCKAAQIHKAALGTCVIALQAWPLPGQSIPYHHSPKASTLPGTW